jgi:hypothetical protein
MLFHLPFVSAVVKRFKCAANSFAAGILVWTIMKKISSLPIDNIGLF